MDFEKLLVLGQVEHALLLNCATRHLQPHFTHTDDNKGVGGNAYDSDAQAQES